MDKVSGKLTVFFEEPLWVECLNMYQMKSYLYVGLRLGAEPKDYEVYDFVLKITIDYNLVWLWQLM